MPSHYGAAALLCALAATPIALVQPHSTKPTAPVDVDQAAPRGGTEVVASLGHIEPQSQLLDWWDRDAPSRQMPGEVRPGERDRERPERPKRSTKGTVLVRTLCVRLCDGFYWPLSYATSADHVARDAVKCETSCPGRARLFLHRNPGEDASDMRDRDGQPYRQFEFAFLYRTQYIPDCTCRGQPWDEAELARHRSYAGDAKAAKSAATR